MQTQKFFLSSSLSEEELIDRIIPLPAKEGPAVSGIKLQRSTVIVGKDLLPGFDTEFLWENNVYLTTSDVEYYKEWLERKTGDKMLPL
ncbi:MAG: hypothetical protein LBD11_06585 [Candidatus Peribacteria bacterium]|jgi:hypothetical protein|nr:hypothetical protein [Candidatus Peribacteria bacterium]